MLPETGSISMQQVNTELKKSGTATISLNDTDVRKLAGKTSGTLSMNDLRGKKASESVNNYSLHSGSYDSNYDSSKTYNFNINIPHKIISGIITLTIVKSHSYGGKESSMNISGIGSIESNGSTKQTKNINVSNLNSGDYNTKVVAYNKVEHSPNQDYQRRDTTYVTVSFTGEWEV